MVGHWKAGDGRDKGEIDRGGVIRGLSGARGIKGTLRAGCGGFGLRSDHAVRSQHINIPTRGEPLMS